MITYTNNLDIYPGNPPIVIKLSQYDTDFSLVFNLFSSRGTLTIASGTTAVFREKKPDGNVMSVDATIDITNKKVTLTPSDTIAKQITAIAGKCCCELSLQKNNDELNTANFVLLVEKAPVDIDEIPSDSVLRELYDVADRADEILEAAETVDAAVEELGTLIDPTLTQAGKAADAKATGDRLLEISEYIEPTYVPITFEIPANSVTGMGITFTQNTNGTVTVNGTNTSSSARAVHAIKTTGNVKIPLNLVGGKTYRLRGCPAGGGPSTYNMDLRFDTGGGIYVDNGSGIIFTLSNDGVYYVNICIGAGYTVDNLVFTPVIEEVVHEEGKPDGYTAIDKIARLTTECIESQTTEYVLVDYPRTNVSGTSSSGIYYEQKTDGTFLVNGTNSSGSNRTILALKKAGGGNATFNLMAGKTYRLRGCPAGGNNGTYNMDLRKSSGGAIYVDNGSGVVFTPSEDLVLYCNICIGIGATVNNVVFTPTVEEVTEGEVTREYSAVDKIARATTVLAPKRTDGILSFHARQLLISLLENVVYKNDVKNDYEELKEMLDLTGIAYEHLFNQGISLVRTDIPLGVLRLTSDPNTQRGLLASSSGVHSIKYTNDLESSVYPIHIPYGAKYVGWLNNREYNFGMTFQILTWNSTLNEWERVEDTQFYYSNLDGSQFYFDVSEHNDGSYYFVSGVLTADYEIATTNPTNPKYKHCAHNTNQTIPQNFNLLTLNIL